MGCLCAEHARTEFKDWSHDIVAHSRSVTVPIVGIITDRAYGSLADPSSLLTVHMAHMHEREPLIWVSTGVDLEQSVLAFGFFELRTKRHDVCHIDVTTRDQIRLKKKYTVCNTYVCMNVQQSQL